MEGVEWGLREETGHGPQIANYSVTMMPLAPECRRRCFWLQISFPVIPPQTNVRVRLHFLPAWQRGVGEGLGWESSHHLKGVRKKPQSYTPHVAG